MIAIPSVRGNGLTGWSGRLNDTEVADLASARSNRGPGSPRRGGFADGDLRPDLVTRPITTMGRGAFDAKAAQGRVGIDSRPEDHTPRSTSDSLARPSAWLGSLRLRRDFAAVLPSSPQLERFDARRRLARTTMRTTPRSHRDRLLSVPQVGCRSGPSSGKGVRAA